MVMVTVDDAVTRERVAWALSLVGQVTVDGPTVMLDAPTAATGLGGLYARALMQRRLA